MARRAYDPETRSKRADKKIEAMGSKVDLRGKRILEVGPHLGVLSIKLARDFGCEVVGIDPIRHEIWPEIEAQHPSIRFIHGDMAAPPPELEESSFDLIVSFVVWEHIRHPWSALQNCQRLLKPTGQKFMQANLYRSSKASHLYNVIDDPWPHLRYTRQQLKKMTSNELGWAFWVNKLTYQQYLFYFRRLGFYVTSEKFVTGGFDQAVYDAEEQVLGLYPKWDLETDFFEVLLEFDEHAPKEPIEDPVYRLR